MIDGYEEIEDHCKGSDTFSHVYLLTAAPLVVEYQKRRKNGQALEHIESYRLHCSHDEKIDLLPFSYGSNFVHVVILPSIALECSHTDNHVTNELKALVIHCRVLHLETFCCATIVDLYGNHDKPNTEDNC